MKKSLLALAVLGAFAGAAQAQTNVTLYGIVDAGIVYSDNGADEGKTWGLESGNQSASRIGFRGTEDLGSGLKASFVLEAGFDVDTGNIAATSELTDEDEDGVADGVDTEARLFRRLAYVGLDGGFGGVRLGRQVSPVKVAIDAIDPFGGAGQNGFYDAVVGFGDYERRDNQITYLTPNVAGFTAQAAYVFGETTGTTLTDREFGAQVGYGNGPINVQVGFHNARDGEDIRNRLGFVGASYNLGVAKLSAGFGMARTEVVGGDEFKSRQYLLGATVPLGSMTLLASYIRNDIRDFDDADTDTLGLGLTYALSKRTNVYTMLTHERNDDDIALNRAAEAGESASVVSFGVRHTF